MVADRAGASRTEGAAASLAEIASEFAEYGALVADARAAAGRNAERLVSIVRAVERQEILVAQTAAAMRSVSADAARTAGTVDRLQRAASAAQDASAETSDGLPGVVEAVDTLDRRLAVSAASVDGLRDEAKALREALATLGRLAGQAQMLSVNAAIEAAHLSDSRSRFAIVAGEVGTLARSTRDAGVEVTRVAVSLQQATESVAAAAAASRHATQATGSDIRRSESSLAETRRSITELEESIAAIAAVTAEQAASLQAIEASIDGIARHAADVARTSAAGAQLRLDEPLARAEAVLVRWTGAARAGGERADDAIARASDDQRAIVAALIEVAAAAARNAVVWRSIDAATAAVGTEIGQIRTAVVESTTAANTAAALAASMRALVNALEDRYGDALETLERALAAVARIGEAIADADTEVASMAAAVARTDEIVALIDTVSSDTDLLSLNAAIEASRAGTSGAGFGVIADEIRRLAARTHDVTAGVASITATVIAESGAMREAIRDAGTSTSAIVTVADDVRSAVDRLRGALASTLRDAFDVSASAEEQARALDAVLAGAERSAAATGADARAGGTDERRLALYAIGSRAHAIAARRGVAPVTARLRDVADRTAARIEEAFDTALARHSADARTAFDLRYEELRGARVASLARLFDVSRVPAGGFDPPKYATPWDALVDEAAIGILDDAFGEAAFARPIMIALTDLNGFTYANPRRLIRDWTGDASRDATGNRVKRILEDEHGLRLIRFGLGDAANGIGQRAAYAEFERAGCALNRPPGERPWVASVYARDVSDVFNDLIMPVYVRGRRHGIIRFAYAIDVL